MLAADIVRIQWTEFLLTLLSEAILFGIEVLGNVCAKSPHKPNSAPLSLSGCRNVNVREWYARICTVALRCQTKNARCCRGKSS
jgi:hypothetical protein